MLPIRPALLALALLLPLPVFAQGANVAFGDSAQDSSAPVEVTSDNLSINQSDGTALYTGNVVIGQGEMRLAAPRVLVIFSDDNSTIDRLEATGGVTLVSGDDAAEAERADYNINGGTMELTGNVLLTQGPSAVTSEKMLVNLDAGTAQMSGRVKTILQSGDQ